MKSRDKVVVYGVPYGARARMILLYLQTQAVRTGSREVALGRSMRDWMAMLRRSHVSERRKANAAASSQVNVIGLWCARGAGRSFSS